MADMATETIEKSVSVLVAKGKARGYLTYEEMNDELPDEAVSPDRLDTLLVMLDELGIVLMDESEAVAKEGGFADDSEVEPRWVFLCEPICQHVQFSILYVYSS